MINLLREMIKDIEIKGDDQQNVTHEAILVPR
jgi:hypothetical protein